MDLKVSAYVSLLWRMLEDWQQRNIGFATNWWWKLLVEVLEPPFKPDPKFIALSIVLAVGLNGDWSTVEHHSIMDGTKSNRPLSTFVRFPICLFFPVISPRFLIPASSISNALSHTSTAPIGQVHCPDKHCHCLGFDPARHFPEHTEQTRILRCRPAHRVS